MRFDSSERVQSPNPFEINSKKSPEKKLCPQPIGLDVATLRLKEDDGMWLLDLGLSTSAYRILTSGFSSFCFRSRSPILVIDDMDICLLIEEELRGFGSNSGGGGGGDGGGGGGAKGRGGGGGGLGRRKRKEEEEVEEEE